MKIEQVKLLKTLKAGTQVWVEGSYFPNKEYTSIPPEILLEATLNTGTVEVTKKSEPPKIVAPKSTDVDQTSTSTNVKTSVLTRASLEEAREKEKAEIETASKPKRKPRKTSKPKLVRRK